VASQGHFIIEHKMTENKPSFGIASHLKSKALLENSQKLMLSSNKIISLLTLQLQRCKLLAGKLTVYK